MQPMPNSQELAQIMRFVQSPAGQQLLASLVRLLSVCFLQQVYFLHFPLRMLPLPPVHFPSGLRSLHFLYFLPPEG